MTGITQAMVDAAIIVLEQLFSPIEALIETYGPVLLRSIVGTPHPDRVFGTPSNGAWSGLHAYYWESIIPLSLGLYGLSLGLVILLETTSHLFSGYHTSRLKKRAFVGLLGILSWWWVAAFSLTLVAGIATFLLPDLSDISLFQTLSFAGIGVLGIAISLAVDLSLFALLAIIYLLRQLVLYLYVLLMPLLIVFWIPGIGPFALVAQFMKRLAGLFVPFLFMTLPVALLFRLGGILGDSVSLSLGGIGQWLTALVVPILAVLVPFVMVWQAGALFFMLDRAGRQVSRGRASERVDSMRSAGGRAREAAVERSQRLRDPPSVRNRSVLAPGGESDASRSTTERAPPGEAGSFTSSIDETTPSDEQSSTNRTTHSQSGTDLFGSQGDDSESDAQSDRQHGESGHEWRDSRLSDLPTLADRTETSDETDKTDP